MYFGFMKYLEIEFIVIQTGSDHTVIQDDLSVKALGGFIDKFLSERIIELKQLS